MNNRQRFSSIVFQQVLLAVLLLLLSACGGDEEQQPFPTIFSVDATDPNAVTNETPQATGQSSTVGSFPTPPASWTPTETFTPAPSITVTPSSTITSTPSWTPTPTPTETFEANALDDFVDLMLRFTPLPPEFQVGPGLGAPTPTVGGFVLPTPTAGGFIVATPTLGGQTSQACPYPAPGGFGVVIAGNPNLVTQLGCPSGAPPSPLQVSSASQNFERGTMLWVNEVFPAIYVFYNDGTFQRFDDTYNASSDPVSGGETPPAGLLEPVRGFGKVWRSMPGVRDRLGWATGGESGGTGVILEFAQGRMMSSTTRGDILILFYLGITQAGTWNAVPGQY